MVVEAVIAVLVVLLALLLWWLLAQLHRHRPGQVLIESEGDAAARLDARALEDAIEEEAKVLDGISHVHVRLTGPACCSGRTSTAVARTSRRTGADSGATER